MGMCLFIGLDCSVVRAWRFSPTPHCNFEVRSAILAPVFVWIASKYCFTTQCLNFQRRLESESTAPPATSLIRHRAMWTDFVVNLWIGNEVGGKHHLSLQKSEGKKEVEKEERGGFSSSALGHRDVMMGWDEPGFAGGLQSVFIASTALQGQCFNPHRADLLPLPVWK